MILRTLSLSLLLLGTGFSSVAFARPQKLHPGSFSCKPKPVSTTLKNYLEQVEAATAKFVALGSDVESIQNRLRAQSKASDPAQPSDEDAVDASMASDPQLLEVLDKLRTVTRAFRNFNPVPHSAAKIDAKLVDFSLKMEHGLDLLQLSMAAPDNQEMQDKALKQLDEATDILPVVATEILVFKQSLEAQGTRKTYVRG